MKFKLDENLGSRASALLRASGHDVATVRDQGLSGITDKALFNICSTEGRVLVTLDRDFGHVPRFPPEAGAGIVILDAGPKASLRAILDRIRDFLAVLEGHTLYQSLWIVEPGRVRIHLRDSPET